MVPRKHLDALKLIKNNNIVAAEALPIINEWISMLEEKKEQTTQRNLAKKIKQEKTSQTGIKQFFQPSSSSTVLTSDTDDSDSDTEWFVLFYWADGRNLKRTWQDKQREAPSIVVTLLGWLIVILRYCVYIRLGFHEVFMLSSNFF